MWSWGGGGGGGLATTFFRMGTFGRREEKGGEQRDPIVLAFLVHVSFPTNNRLGKVTN